jgi:hypothetical protein
MAILAKGLTRESLYALNEWEVCEGTLNLAPYEASECINEWLKADKELYGRLTTTYKWQEDGLDA